MAEVRDLARRRDRAELGAAIARIERDKLEDPAAVRQLVAAVMLARTEQ